MLNVCDFIQVYVFTTNHHLKHGYFIVYLSKAVLLLWVSDDVAGPRSAIGRTPDS